MHGTGLKNDIKIRERDIMINLMHRKRPHDLMLNAVKVKCFMTNEQFTSTLYHTKGGLSSDL